LKNSKVKELRFELEFKNGKLSHLSAGNKRPATASVSMGSILLCKGPQHKYQNSLFALGH